jgi:1-acyl-sn-glycerol-3-phosphate acyltransferase
MADELSPIREQVYRDPRPPEHFAPYHERARTREPDWVYTAVRVATTALALAAFRARAIDPENVPACGPVILAPNHFSFMDHFLVGMFLRRRVRFMAKSQLFRPPMDAIYTHGGVFPVRRGHRDEEAFVTANVILERGGCVVMYAEGGRSRSGRLADQVRPGLGRLALESGAPVVPVAIYGSERARNWRRGRFPTVTVQYGQPMRLPRDPDPDRAAQQAASEAIFARVRELHAGLVRDHGGRDRARLTLR